MQVASDFSGPATSVVNTATSIVEVVFDASREPYQFLVCHLQTELKITLDAKWQRRSFVDAVVEPFCRAYNKKSPVRPLTSTALSCVLVDSVEAADFTKLVDVVVPSGVRRVDLLFGQRPSTSQQRGNGVLRCRCARICLMPQHRRVVCGRDGCERK